MQLSIRFVVLSLALAATAAALLWLGIGRRHHTTTLGFWFEPIVYSATPIGDVTPVDVERIEQVARAEVAEAFARFAVTVTDQRDAPYKVVVVTSVRDPRFRSEVDVAGASRAVTGFGGTGNVNFRLLAGHAVGTRPENADRPALLDAIGRGIGRAAVHEFVHQLLPTAAIHGDDRSSYEYGSASRAEQYYGPMHWDIALPMLARRLAPRRGPN